MDNLEQTTRELLISRMEELSTHIEKRKKQLSSLKQEFEQYNYIELDIAKREYELIKKALIENKYTEV